ncbi:MAG: hypothetical protein AB1540_08735 [Bdellovibrionota bacterium]
MIQKIISVVLFLTSSMASASTVASTVESGVPQSAVTLQARIDFKEGLLYYRTHAELPLALSDGQERRIRVRFKGRPISMLFIVRASKLNFSSDSQAWAFEVAELRQESGGGDVPADLNRFILSPGDSKELHFGIWHQGQLHKIRMTLGL